MKSVSFLGVSFAQVGSQASQRFEFSVPRRARVHQRCLLLPIASECDGSQVVFAQNRSGTDCGIGKFSTHRHHHYRGKKDTGCFCVVLSLVFFFLLLCRAPMPGGCKWQWQVYHCSSRRALLRPRVWINHTGRYRHPIAVSALPARANRAGGLGLFRAWLERKRDPSIQQACYSSKSVFTHFFLSF